ncbi:MAG: right-handed parallel beta-helix repeat-containing protein [Candidatus Eisenbacteria sp.]|nr:right-handed parallel beta-helix repeat-containing protein [Candidatus Eisenbacteria bacterium]
MWRLSFTLTLACLVPSLAAARTWYVLPDSSGDAPTIQAAIDSASAGDVVELADGTFTGEGNRNIDFLGKAITVCSEAGDAENCVIECQGTLGVFKRGFRFASGEDSASVLRGVTIRGGVQARGGAVYCKDTSPTLEGCVFLENNARLDGGAVRIDGGSPRIVSCEFSYNVCVTDGAGLSARGSSTPTLEACIFRENDAGDAGGGAMFLGDCAPVLTECEFIGNQAWILSGGALCSRCRDLQCSSCTFSDNWAQDGGGAVSCSGSARLESCTFEGNRTPSYGSEHHLGGAVYANGESESIEIVGCTFRENSASEHGGAVWGLKCSLTECRFESNTARCGGGVTLASGQVSGCSFVRNTATEDGGGLCVLSPGTTSMDHSIFIANAAHRGGGIFCDDAASLAIVACTLHGNEASGAAGAIVSSNASVDMAGVIVAFSTTRAVYCWGATPALTCCDLYGNAEGDWAGPIAGQLDQDGNISSDPLFCDPMSEDFTLHEDSPCAPAYNPDCGLIGAKPVACPPSPALEISWGAMKAMFRGQHE